MAWGGGSRGGSYLERVEQALAIGDDRLRRESSVFIANISLVADRRIELRERLDELVKRGEQLLLHEHLGNLSDEELRDAAKQVVDAGTQFKPEIPIKGKGKARRIDRSKLDRLGHDYQGWYSTALAVVDQLLHDRATEFRELYRLDRPPKALTWTTYTVSDYLSGTGVSNYVGEESFDHKKAGLDRFEKQVAILGSARDRMDSLVGDITGVLEAELFDDELGAAESLLAAKHRRAAGVIAGVVLERHLKRLIDSHGVTFRKKALLGNLNEALKEAKVYGVPEWRRIQHLTDLRNLCGHDAEREPTKDEVDDLIRGVEKVVTTVF
jgi:hypothetical protein